MGALRALAGVGVCTLLALMGPSGCQVNDDSGLTEMQRSVSLGDGPITRIEGFDHKKLGASLQGDWIVVQGDKRVFEFNIVKDQVRVLDHRFTQPRTIRGRLLLRSSTSFGVASNEGPRYFFGFVEVDGQTFMGHGGALALRGDESAFVLTLGAWESLRYSEDGCELVSTFGGGESTRGVECSFIEETSAEGETRRTGFRYQAPDPFRPERLKRVELTLKGGYLIDTELARSIASRRGDVSPANELRRDESSGRD